MSILNFLNTFHKHKDKNDKEIKPGDVVKILNPALCKPEDRLLVREQYLPEINWLWPTLVLYNPNCCESCRKGFSYVFDIWEIKPEEIEIQEKLMYEEL